MPKTEELSELHEKEIFRQRSRRPATFSRKELAYLRLQNLIRNPPDWQGRWAPTFWTISGSISLIINIFLIALLIGVAREMFALKTLLSNQLANDLQPNFSAMETAVFETTITVNENIQVTDVISITDTIPVVFDLDLSKNTKVKLTENTAIDNAIINITTPNLSIYNAPADIVLPKDTILPSRLNLTVPVSQTVPINLSVPVVLDVPVSLSIPVSIPLKNSGLQEFVAPYQELLSQSPNSWEEAACEAGIILCWLFGQ